MQKMPCVFFLMRYVPDVVKGEFVNIGVVLREAIGTGSQPRTAVRFTRDWSRVKSLDRGADIEMLESLEQEVVRRLESGKTVRDPEGVIETLEETLSNSVQMTAARATLADSLNTEMDLLMGLHVESMVPESKLPESRLTTFGGMQRQFERAGVWHLMQKQIRASPFTHRGDPLKIDCGYTTQVTRSTPNTVLRMFHALSLTGDLDSAKGLAHSARMLHEGVARVANSSLQMNAVIEERSQATDPEQELYEFGKWTLQQEGITVLTLPALAGASQTAIGELLAR